MKSFPIPLFLALRYLRPRRTYVSVITVISVLGVMLGVMVLILVISVMSGFDRELRQKVLGLNAHLTITTGSLFQDWQRTMMMIEKRPHVQGVSPFIVGPVLAKFSGRVFTPYLKGIDPVRENKVSNLKRYMIKGSFNFENDQMVVGTELARRFGIFI